MKNPIVVLGIGELGSVFARAFLKNNHAVYPITRSTDINELKSELNLQNLMIWSNFPGVKHEDCMKSIKLFTEKVMPNFQDDIDLKKVS